MYIYIYKKTASSLFLSTARPSVSGKTKTDQSQRFFGTLRPVPPPSRRDQSIPYTPYHPRHAE